MHAGRKTGKAQNGMESMLAVIEKYYVFIYTQMKKISFEKDNQKASNSGYL